MSETIAVSLRYGGFNVILESDIEYIKVSLSISVTFTAAYDHATPVNATIVGIVALKYGAVFVTL